ncbi:M24 family metallopeptidase [Lachnospiraceae bacterium 62-35]
MAEFVRRAEYKKVAQPKLSEDLIPVVLTDKTMEEHRQKVLKRMEEREMDALLLYADREHGDNFQYLTGFSPRFEEAGLVLHRTGEAFLLLGNESLRMERYSRVKARAIHVPYFSLPNQPMETEHTMKELLELAGLHQGMKTGIAGWKMFTSRREDNRQLYDVPYFFVEAVKQAVGDENTVSAGELFIHPETGARILVNANEIAHYEFGAALASSCVGKAMNEIRPGRTEMEIAQYLAAFGQQTNVQTICASGERFTNAIVEPRNKKIVKGEKLSITMGFPGGLTSRSGYVAAEKEELEGEAKDYMELAVKPYFSAAAAWYETIGLGVTGGEIFEAVDRIFPKAVYGWALNPGHFVSSEEWMSSPIEKGSLIKIKSGMMLQMDIIPQAPGRSGSSAEDGIAVADESLRKELQAQYPQVWERIKRRRAYMEGELGIRLKEEVLPLSDMTGYLRPYLLKQDWAMSMTDEKDQKKSYMTEGT